MREETKTPLTLPEAADPATFGLGVLAYLRVLERRAGAKPRIGRNERLRDAVVRLGQDPLLHFADREISRIETRRGVPEIRPNFVGLFGPFGPLPLNWTEEVARWFENGDRSFVSFTDIFASRFQELFFRAWSDAHPITQFDHPTDDRFQTYLLSLMGSGTPGFRNRDELADTVRARLAPLAMGRVRSPLRLKQMLALHFGDRLSVEIEELVPSWLEFEPDALAQLGRENSDLGVNLFLGSRTRSLSSKIRIHVTARTLAEYRRLLPDGADHDDLRDITFWYLGQALEIELALWLPAAEIAGAELSAFAQLGYMACMVPPADAAGDATVKASEFLLRPRARQPGDIATRAA